LCLWGPCPCRWRLFGWVLRSRPVPLGVGPEVTPYAFGGGVLGSRLCALGARACARAGGCFSGGVLGSRLCPGAGLEVTPCVFGVRCRACAGSFGAGLWGHGPVPLRVVYAWCCWVGGFGRPGRSCGSCAVACGVCVVLLGGWFRLAWPVLCCLLPAACCCLVVVPVVLVVPVVSGAGVVGCGGGCCWAGFLVCLSWRCWCGCGGGFSLTSWLQRAVAGVGGVGPLTFGLSEMCRSVMGLVLARCLEKTCVSSTRRPWWSRCSALSVLPVPELPVPGVVVASTGRASICSRVLRVSRMT